MQKFSLEELTLIEEKIESQIYPLFLEADQTSPTVNVQDVMRLFNENLSVKK